MRVRSLLAAAISVLALASPATALADAMCGGPKRPPPDPTPAPSSSPSGPRSQAPSQPSQPAEEEPWSPAEVGMFSAMIALGGIAGLTSRKGKQTPPEP